MDRYAENTEFSSFKEYYSDHEGIDCPFCGDHKAILIASMKDSVKTILYYACKMCGDFQTRRNAYGLHGTYFKGGGHDQD